jgi:predicted transcriptional regulator of viral defense system
MRDFFRRIETPYVDAQTLLSLLNDYRKPREWISRMVKKGELIRLKNGFYLISEKIRQGPQTLIPFEQVANLLYGPSYVSLEWALSFYGMIPERVHTVTSITLGKNKEFHTPVGDFTYSRVSSDHYPIGIVQKSTPGFVGGFLMASPEKALADLVFKTCKGLTKEELKLELLESKRIDPESLRQLNKPLLEEIAKSYNSKRVDNLIYLIGMI